MEAVASGEDDDSDDLWDFTGPEQLEEAEKDNIDPNEPQILSHQAEPDSPIPIDSRKSKRRRVQPKDDQPTKWKLEESDSDVELVCKTSGNAASGDNDDFFQLKSSSALPLPRQKSKAESEKEAALLRNKAALQTFKALLDAPEEVVDEQELQYSPPLRDKTSVPAELTEATSDQSQPHVSDKIVIKCTTKHSAEAIKLRVGRQLPFEKIFEVFKKIAISKGWITQETLLRFFFDGDKLSSKDTVEGLDIDDDCVIEVYW